MTPSDFPEANTLFGPPPDFDESQVQSIPAYVGTVARGSVEGSSIVVVAWKPTPHDRVRLEEGGVILFPPSNVHPSASHTAPIMSNPHRHELNPNNPLVSEAHSQWHAICAIIMAKLKLSNVEITEEDLARVKGQSIVIDNRNQQLNIRLVSDDEAKRLARQNGGQFKPS